MNALSTANIYHIIANGLHALPWATIHTYGPWALTAITATAIALLTAVVYRLHQRP